MIRRLLADLVEWLARDTDPNDLGDEPRVICGTCKCAHEDN